MANMYRVGDYVYFETSATLPYLIRRIEELNRTQNGNVEAKVMCFFRRRDISPSLVVYADKNQSGALEDDDVSDSENGVSTPVPTMDVNSRRTDMLNSEDRHQLRHRELFLSRQIEILPATHIRGKCSVTLLNETEAVSSYLNKEDTFFYSLVFDPQQKTLLADKGEIRVGSTYQAEICSLLKEGEVDTRKMEDLETLVWTQEHNLTDKQIDQFLVVTRSVGTFARALDGCSSVKQPSLHMSAAAASRDITLFHAMDTLHKCTYDVSRAVCGLVPSSGPLLSRDEMEEWSAAEANLFEEALEKYGKDFTDIRQDFLPWKTLKNVVEYYYMWKTTDRYVQQKRVKAVESESKLKQVYIPNYSRSNPSALTNGKSVVNGSNGDVTTPSKPCEACECTSSSQWHSWGSGNVQCRLCTSCWHYWKKFGGLKYPSKMAKDEAVQRLEGRPIEDLIPMVKKGNGKRSGKVSNVSTKLGQNDKQYPGWMEKKELPENAKQLHIAFPKPPKGPDGSLLYTPVPNKEIPLVNSVPSILKRRAYEETNGVDAATAPPPKKLKETPVSSPSEALDTFRLNQLGVNPPPGLTVTPIGGPVGVNGNVPPPSVEASMPASVGLQLTVSTGAIQHASGRAKIATVSRIPGKPKIISWMDAPDDVYFYATDSTKKLRKTLTVQDLKRAARRPWRKVKEVTTIE